MKNILLYIIWSVILCATGGQLNGDPAPGRSPGPPAHPSTTHTKSIPATLQIIANATAATQLQINDVLFDANDDVNKIGRNDNQPTDAVPAVPNSARTGNHKLVRNINNVTNVVRPVDEAMFLVRDQTDRPAGRKSCNSANTLGDYLNRTRAHNQKVLNVERAARTNIGAGQLSSSSVWVDVTHDVFDVAHGLVNNIVYMGKSRLDHAGSCIF